MFEYKENHLMGPKSELDSGGDQNFFCSAYGAAEDQLAELARIVGSSDDDSRPSSKEPASSIQLVEDAPALEFDLEGELSRAFQDTEMSEDESDIEALMAVPEENEAPISSPKIEEAPAQEPHSDDYALNLDEDLLGDEFERALVAEVAADADLTSDDPMVHLTAPEEGGDSMADSHGLARQLDPQPDISNDFPSLGDVAAQMNAGADQQPQPRSLATPTALDQAPAAASLSELQAAVASINTGVPESPSDDFKAELSRLLGHSADPVPEPAPQPAQAVEPDPVVENPALPVAAAPAPQPMQAPWDGAEIVQPLEVPTQPIFVDEPRSRDGLDAPQMSDYKPAQQDYSDPAADLEDLFVEEGISSNATSVLMADTPSVEIDSSRVDAAVAGLAATSAVMAAASSSTDAAARAPQRPEPVPEFDVPTFDPNADFDVTEQFAAQMEPVYYDSSEQIPEADAPMDFPEKRITPKKAAVAIAAVALLGGVALVGWSAIGGDGDPAPKILASSDPVKVKPENAGGVVVPNQDQAVFQSVDGGKENETKQARLQDDSEKPLAVASQNGLKSAVRAPAVDGGTTGALGEIQPRRVRTVVVKPDGTIVSTTAAPAPDSGIAVKKPVLSLKPQGFDSGSATRALTEPRTVTYSAPRADEAGSETAAKPVKVASVEAKPVKVETIAPKPAKVAPKKPAKKNAALPSKKSPFAVQVSSQRSADAAKKTYQTLSKRFASVIGGKGVDIQKAVVKGKSYFRVRIPASSRAAANKMCSNLKAKGGACFVTR